MTFSLWGIVSRWVREKNYLINFEFRLYQQNVEKVKGYEYLLKALYMYIN